MSNVRLSLRLFSGLAVLAMMVGCGSSSATPAAISVAISTTPVAMVAGATQAFTATTNDSAGVTWTASVGTITAAGVYTAPTPVSTTSATITATSKSDTSKTATVPVTLTPIVVYISPTTVTLVAGKTQQYSGVITGDDKLNQGVTWSASVGTITTGGLYTAPTPVPTTPATITVTSVTDPSKTATATVTFTPVTVSVSPTTATLIGGASTAITPTVTGDTTLNQGVTWRISPATGAGTGVFNSNTGVYTYTAPAVVGSVTSATVTATSVTDPSQSASTVITLTPISVGAINPATISLGVGSQQSFTGAAVSNDSSNSGVTWSISPATGAGSINSSGLYTAPTTVISTATTVTVTATSVKDTTKTATATITLNPIAIAFTTTTSGVTLDSGQTLALAAAVSNDGSSSGATFTATGAGSVSPASATGNTPSTTLTATGTTASSVTVTATSIKDTSKTITTSSITVNPALAITTAAGALASGTTGTAYAGATIAASGGTGTKTFAIASGALPTGLTLGTTTGAISGTPTSTAQTFTFTVKVTDSATTPVTVTSGTYTILLNPAPLVCYPGISTGTYTVGTAITPFTVSSTGGTGTITYAIYSGTLPAGITLNSSTGVVSGTPTAPTVASGNNIAFKATDSATTPVTAVAATITLTVNPVTLAITTTTLPTGTVGTAYNSTGYQLASTGGTGTVTWAMSPTTADGLTLSTTGLLSGTPSGTYSSAVTITATDSATNQQQTKSITPTLNVVNALSITTLQSALPYATSGSAYSTTLAATGGYGTLAWSVTSGLTGSNSLATLSLAVSSAGVITGTPTVAGTATFTVKVTDSATTPNTSSQTYTITSYTALALPAANPSSLGPASTTSSYSGSVTATGGSGSYTWSINSGSYGTGSTSLGNGSVQASVSGATLNISGQPSTVGTITFTASVKDTTTGLTSSTVTYTIAVTTTYAVNGQVNFVSTSGCTVATPTSLPTITLTQSGTTVKSITISSNGSYSISGLSSGTYTLTPSVSGSTAVFYPATQTITIGSSSVTAAPINADIVYTVSGTVSYSGSYTPSQTKPIYLILNPSNCSGGGTQGTTLTSTGSYTIRGVSPGTYTLNALLDAQGTGVNNAGDPVGSASGTISNANATGANVTLSDPAAVSLSSTSPKINGGGGFANGVLLQYKPITNSNGVEMPASYTLQWSTTSDFGSIVGSKTFPAKGTNVDIWMLNSSSTVSSGSAPVNGSAYYFRAYATAGSSTSSTSSVYGPITLSAPTGGNSVTGAITLPAASTYPLYVGFFNYNTGVFYGQYFASPSATQSYSISVPTATSYYFVAVLDQNNDGQIDAGDLQNTTNLNTATSISGATTNENLSLTPYSNNTLTGMATEATNSGSSSLSYALDFYLFNAVKQPIAVTLTTSGNSDGANVAVPMDIAICVGISNCGERGFKFYVNLGAVAPSVGDNYTFNVTYSDGTTGTVIATVSTILSAFATNLSPTGSGASHTPTFTWTYPTNASNYTYYFSICCSNNSDIWDIPGNNYNGNGFTSSQVSASTGIAWITSGNDVIGESGNVPTVSALTSGTTYQWQIQVIDSNGNIARTQANFVAQ